MAQLTTNVMYGNDLHLFTNTGTDALPVWKNIANATSHSIKTSVDTRDVSSKDSGDFEEFVAGKMSFEVSVEALVTTDATNGYDTLFDKMVAKELITIVSGIYKTDGSLDTTKRHYKGTCLITSLDISAGKGENITYSASLKGTGALTKVTV